MEIEVLEKTKDKLKIKLRDETHTLCNILRKELWNDKDIKISGYSIAHSLVDDPVLIIEGKDPKKSLLDAIKRLKEKNKEFRTKFKAALK